MGWFWLKLWIKINKSIKKNQNSLPRITVTKGGVCVCAMARDLFRKKCAKCNITAAEDQNLSFHRFPLPGKHGLSRIRVWAEYCYPGEDWSSEKSLKDLHFQHKMVCSKHFDDSCYTNSARTRLNIFALPTGAQDLISVDVPQLAKENNMELVKVKCELYKNILEPNCSSLKQEAEMDIAESIADMHAVLHGFPNPNKDRLRFNTWLYSIGSDILGLENAHKLKYRRVCHRHFQDKYVCRNNRISNIAVPTLYLPDPEIVVYEQVPPSTSQSIEQNFESKAKVSADQTSILCNFFEENPEVLRGYKRTPKCMDKVQIKWKNITPHLNAVGPPRDHRSWAKYLCDMKAKLKRKSIKWRQSCDGKDPIMCNTNDFNEIGLRMLQVLRKDVSSSQESQDSHTSDLETEDDNNAHNKGENYEIEILPDVKPKLECLEENSQVINDTPPPDLQPRQLVFEDEFDYFGKNVAEQLRTLPILVALETQEMLLSVLKKQRLKVLQDPLSHN